MIGSARRILITTHTRPDGDAVGCMAALKNVIEREAKLKGRDCPVQQLLLSEPADVYKYLLDESVWLMGRDLTAEQVAAGALDDFDLIIVADTCAVRQLVDIGDYLRARSDKAQADPASSGGVLVIDHHLSSDPLGNCRLVDTAAGAAGQIVYDLFDFAGWKVEEVAAEALLVAIGSDTGWFRFENTSARVFHIAARLLEAGARADAVYQKLYQNDPPQRQRLLARTLDTLELLCNGRLAVMHITLAMLAECGADKTHIENIVNQPMQIGSVLGSVLLVELDSGATRGSLRSKAKVDVNEIARQFGGGGHARAAGLTIEEPLPQARQKILAAMTRALA